MRNTLETFMSGIEDKLSKTPADELPEVVADLVATLRGVATRLEATVVASQGQDRIDQDEDSFDNMPV
jgi:hypothetical protein